MMGGRDIIAVIDCCHPIALIECGLASCRFAPNAAARLTGCIAPIAAALVAFLMLAGP